MRLRVVVVAALAAVGSVLSVAVALVRVDSLHLLHRLVAVSARSLSRQRLVGVRLVHWLAVELVGVQVAGLEGREQERAVSVVLVPLLSRAVVVVVGEWRTMAASHCRNPKASASTPRASAAELTETALND